MTSTPLDKLAPLVPPLPALPKDEGFTKEQWTTLLAIMDAVIPSIRRESTGGDAISQLTIADAEYAKVAHHIQETVTKPPTSAALKEYFEEKPSGYPQYKDFLHRMLGHYAREDARKRLAGFLSALNTRDGSLAMSGTSTPFHELPVHTRESIIQSWRWSDLALLNAMYKQMTFMGKVAWLRTSPTFAKVTGFPVAPDRYQPGKHYEYEFVQFPAGTGPEVIETDIVIVGSGCGGAVAAKNLAEAGHKVLVVDKGYYFRPEQLPMTELAGAVHLFENGGSGITDDGSTSLISASTWGGGGTVNWSASLHTQSYVRKEWAQDRGLTFFETAEFQNCLDRVCNRMGVSADNIKHNHGNRVVLEGARKLGYAAEAVPQNTGGHEHACGHCGLGCGFAQKQGPVQTWLPDAAIAGAKFVEGFKIDRVIFDESSGTKVATGVKGVWTGRDPHGRTDGDISDRIVREVIVKAKRVVISCGSSWSPVVLLNSGLKNQQIGQNLYLHLVNMVGAVYKEDIRPWEGGILTTVCTTFENLDGRGHGPKLEVPCMLPSWFLNLMNWNSGLSYKTQALKFRHSNGFISINRNRDPGRVWVDPVTGKPRIDYTPSAHDRAHVMEGNIALAKICYVTGAREIHVCNSGLPPFIRDEKVIPSSASGGDENTENPGITDPRFCAWLEEMKKIGNAPPVGTFASPHQMGGNRMSVLEKDGVVDPKGRVWGTKGLYVCDGSVFPSASGVNPMVTIMAVSDWISRGIGRELRSEQRVNGEGSRL